VLPFVNLSRDPENEYFSDGMTEELIVALSKVRGLRVAARTSAFAFKGKNVPIRRIGEDLNVQNILEGSVRREGTRLLVTAQLVDVADGFDRWSERYDRQLSDVFAVQDEIARAITGALKVTLGSGADSTLIQRPTDDLEAYNYYLKGRQALGERTFSQLVQASELFKQAIGRDPRFARASAALADTYVLMPLYGNLAPAEAWPKARTAAENALALDSSLAEAHTALAYGAMIHDWDWASAERGFRRAIALDPNYATAYQWYSDYLLGRGRLRESLQAMQRAHELDPLSSIISGELARVLFYLGRTDEAIDALQETLQRDPGFAWAHRWLGAIYQQKGREPEALAELRKAVDLSGRRATNVGRLANAHVALGNRDSAQALLAELTDRSRREYVTPLALVYAYLGLKDTSRALEWLQKAADDHDGTLPRILSIRPSIRCVLTRVSSA
jgi:serine/threonine-protein kinase